jgi:ribosomal-protein-alanine N-acetyltransferase
MPEPGPEPGAPIVATAEPEALAALHEAAFTVPRPWTAAEFAALLARPGAVLAALPQGFALLQVTADEAELLTLAVAPAARRQGLGRRLLAAGLEAAARRGAAWAFLEVAADNAPARALYAATGFVEVGRRRGYYGGVDALLLRRAIAATEAS